MSIAIAELENTRARIAELGYDWRATGVISVPRCPVCRCAERVELARRDRYGFDVSAVECHDCGTVYLAEILSPSGYADFYTNWYRRLLSVRRPQEKYDFDSLEKEQKSYGCKVWPGLCGWLQDRSGQTLLDVGGSTGVHADMAREVYGVVPTVLDPCQAELAGAVDRGMETILGTMTDVPLWRKFDIVTMFQAVEHLPRPVESLFCIRSLLADNGIFIFDHRPFDEQRQHWHVEQIVKIDHPIYLSKYAATQLIERCGFRKAAMLPLTGGHVHYVCRLASRPILELGHALN